MIPYMNFNTITAKEQIDRIDNDCFIDKIPVASTLNSACDVAQKIFYTATMSKRDIDNDFYCKHICDKSLLRSVTLMIPVLGQIAVFSYDWLKGIGDGTSLANATWAQRMDRTYVLQFLKNAPEGVEQEIKPNQFLSNKVFMKQALEMYGPKVLDYAQLRGGEFKDLLDEALDTNKRMQAARFITDENQAIENIAKYPEIFLALTESTKIRVLQILEREGNTGIIEVTDRQEMEVKRLKEKYSSLFR